MREPHKISRQLAGEHRLMLASSGGRNIIPKHMELILSVDEDNGWSVSFRVKVGDKVTTVYALSTAIRLYDEAEASR